MVLCDYNRIGRNYCDGLLSAPIIHSTSRRISRVEGTALDTHQVFLGPLALLDFLALLHHPLLHGVLFFEHYDNLISTAPPLPLISKEYLQFASSSRVGPLVSG
jgi:hypothetical protein